MLESAGIDADLKADGHGLKRCFLGALSAHGGILPYSCHWVNR